MDSEHRHELEQNDLEAFLAKIVENKEKLTWALIIIALVVAAWLFYTRSQENAQAEVHMKWDVLATAQTPAGLDEIIEDDSAPASLVLFAHLNKADRLLEEGLKPGTGSESKEKQRTLMFEQAVTHYQSVIDHPKTKPLLSLNAMLGKASALESLGQWDEAKAVYEGMLDQSKVFPSIEQMAKARLAVIDRIKEPITFATEVTLDDNDELNIPDELPENTGDADSGAEDSIDNDSDIPPALEDDGSTDLLNPGSGNTGQESDDSLDLDVENLEDLLKPE